MTTYRAEDQSGHAVHFLKRLNRASGESAAFALQLYHDPQLLRDSLLGIRIPETCDRVAVSLHEADKGPYVVASRNGKFVTCLAEDMSLGGLHLIPFSQIKAHLVKSEIHRERLSMAEELASEEGGFGKLFRRIHNKAEDLSREEFLAISALQPALQRQFFSWIFLSGTRARDLSRYLHQQKKVGKKEEETVKSYYRYFYTAGHLAALSGMSRLKTLESFVKEIAEGREEYNIVGLMCTLLRSGRMYMAVRLAWLIGKIGPALLPMCRRRLVNPQLPEAWLLGLLSTLIIAIRHRKTLQQAIKAITASFKAIDNYPWAVVDWIVKCNRGSDRFYHLVDSVISNPDKIYEEIVDRGKQISVNFAAKHSLPAPYNWTAKEEVPEETALALMSSNQDNFQKHFELIEFMILLTPWLARCEAEDLYPPGDLVKSLYVPWTMDLGLKLLEDERDRLGTPMPVIVEKTPGRNEPCPCGSGKKYKKCCAHKVRSDNSRADEIRAENLSAENSRAKKA